VHGFVVWHRRLGIRELPQLVLSDDEVAQSLDPESLAVVHPRVGCFLDRLDNFRSDEGLQ
jgi:hypothetical protein